MSANAPHRAAELAGSLVATLPADRPGLFNPWADRCHFDTELNGPERRLERLAQHLDCQPRVILIGEAPGYQGCRYSGVAFTSERQLLAGAIPRVDRPLGRLTTRENSFTEPSATIVWNILNKLGIQESTVLWNALQMHPFRDGVHTNRTPTDAELELGRPALRILVAAFPAAMVIAVGRKAEGLLARAGVRVHAVVRHPANGGATEFASGLMRALWR